MNADIETVIKGILLKAIEFSKATNMIPKDGTNNMETRGSLTKSFATFNRTSNKDIKEETL